MMIMPFLRPLALTGLVLAVVVGCATAPTQEMSDARQAIQAARDAGAEEHAPEVLDNAQSLLAKAERSIADSLYEPARADAVAAKKEAVKARNIALAIGAAQAVLDEAKSLGAEWRESRKLLDKASEAAKAGDEETAVKLANNAKRQAEEAINRHYLENAKILLSEAEKRKSQMSPDQTADYNDARAAYRSQEGKRAYDLASRLMAALKGGVDRYTVVRGDNLWDISGKYGVYDNPYQWPLILKANAHRIEDADLIVPDQELRITRGISSAEIDAAIRHARTRGAWSLGVVEESDKAFLNRY